MIKFNIELFRLYKSQFFFFAEVLQRAAPKGRAATRCKTSLKKIFLEV